MTKHSTQSHTRKAPDAAGTCFCNAANRRDTHEIQERRRDNECGHRRARCVGFCSRARAASRAKGRLRSDTGALSERRSPRRRQHDSGATGRSASSSNRGGLAFTRNTSERSALRDGLFVSCPENVPSNVGPQLFAANSALSGSFDQWAVLSGNPSVLILPLTHSALADAAELRERLLRTEDLGGFVYGIHVGPV